MPKEPIQELKEELKTILPLFDQLQGEINASRKNSAVQKFEEIQERLENLKSLTRNNFQWLAPEPEPTPQKKSFFGMKR